MRPELTIDDIERLGRLLAGRETIDVAPMVWDQRVVKTPWEQEIYRRLGRIAAEGFRDGLAAVGSGVGEDAIERRMWQSFIDSGAGGSPVGGQLMIRSGPERHLVFCGRASSRTLRKGDQLMLAGGPALDGYHIDIHRFACVGPVPDLQRSLHAQSEAGLAAAIGAVRPGVPMRAVFEAARDAMAGHQATKVVPWRVFGHGVGLDNYEPPLISADDATEIKAGMVLALEVPAYDVPEARVMGAFLEECVLVLDDGAEVLTGGVGRGLWMTDGGE
jgi:Xaa-Pro aminopeptidase